MNKEKCNKTEILSNDLNIETSILMTYFNKQNEIKLILEAFLLQTVAKETFEIIIVDDGSKISIQKDVNTYKEKGLNITLLEKKHTGNRALNRRFAVEASKGKNLIFLDADMIPCRTFVEKHNKNLIQNRKTVSLGYRKLLSKISYEVITPDTIKNNFECLETIPCILDERKLMILAHKKIDLDLTSAWYLVYAHNIALKKSLYEKISGFDEGFGSGWGAEDVELGLQLYKQGAYFIFDEEICLYHLWHGVSNTTPVDYQKNLLYFYNKYKSFEPEIFMKQQFLDSVSICKLYKTVYSGLHLSENLIEDLLMQQKNTLFVGFKNIKKEMLTNNNGCVSTFDDSADYKLIGSFLPYKTDSFEQIMLSNKYSVFSTEYLYEIIKELLRVGKRISIINKNKITELDDFWKEKTKYTFSEFSNLKKARVVITANSENRYNNVLYLELLKALNDNGYYASLEITGDELKNQTNIFPLDSADDEELMKYYQRSNLIFSGSIESYIDELISNNHKGCFENLVWWGDLLYYGQPQEIMIERNRIYNKVLVRNENCILKPGIRANKINSHLKNSKKKYINKNILIIDLNLDNVDEIMKFIEKIETSKLNAYTITIVTFASLLEDFKLYANLKYQVHEEIYKKQIRSIENKQMIFEQRLSEISKIAKMNDAVYLKNSNGNLNEIELLIKKNSIFVDFTKRKEFNPYLLQAAAFGLQVYTTSNVYEIYNYPNINIISYKEKSILNDLDFYYDRNGCVRTELLYKKRIMNIPELINKIEKVDEQKLRIEELIQINNKNDWKHIFRI